MGIFPQGWPPWLMIACAVAAAGALVWVLARALRWILWLILAAALVAGAVAAVRLLFR